MSFTPDLFTYLHDLAENNDREWFQAHKPTYERAVKQASYDFIEALAPLMADISPHIRCDKKALFRIYRDVRFSKNKAPYKTHVGLHFRHAAGKDAHAPGFYVHLEPGAAWFGMGIWMPDGAALKQLRAFLVDERSVWGEQVAALKTSGFDRIGDRLKTAPRGVAKDHPDIEELRYKSHVWSMPLADAHITDATFHERVADAALDGSGMMRQICRAVGQPW